MSRYSWLTAPDGYLVRMADDGRTVELRAVGNFDMANATTLTSCLLDVLHQQRHARVDMSEVAFLDVVCLDELIAMHRLFATHGRSVRLSRPSRPVRRLLNVAGIESELVHTTVGV